MNQTPFAETRLKVLEKEYLEMKEINAELLAACKRSIQALEANGAPNCEAVKEMKKVILKAEGR